VPSTLKLFFSMTDTNQLYDHAIAQCKNTFIKKTADYGTSWRVYRTISIADQIYIKAKRVKTIQDKQEQKIGDGIKSEFEGILNYAVIGLIQLELKNEDVEQLSVEEVSKMFPYIDADPLELQEEVDSFMKEFDENEEMELAERLRQSKEPDDDGFIKVVSKSKRKRPDNDLDENVSARKANTASRSRNKKKKPKELKNFYRFQIKEAKVKQLDDLRKKFEEDKVKVSKMKEDRKFKPF
jgi:hypothetical protein